MGDDFSADDVLRPRSTWDVMLKRGFRKRCPRCGAAGLFDSWFRMKARCPGCGYLFEREPGFFVGAYLINFAFTEGLLFLMIMGFVFVLATNSDASIVAPLIVGGMLAVIGPIVFYPFARTIWSAIDLAMAPLELDEIVAAGDHLDGPGSESGDGGHPDADGPREAVSPEGLAPQSPRIDAPDEGDRQ